jgi:quercetin dioxygenase-like cupin family protein
MSKQTHKGSRQEEKLKIISSVKGPVAYMMPEDIGKLVVHSSKISGYLPITPSYATDEIGVDNVKVLMATDNLISFESFRSKGAIDAAHSHPDHHSVAYQKQGRVKMQIGKETFTVEEGDTYFHPMGIVHQHEALEDSIRIETKIFPNGGAVAAWNELVGIEE